MLQFLTRRLLFISVVCIFIVFFVYLGMGMARNSELPVPNYDLVEHSLTAWEQTQTFFRNGRQGEWGSLQTDTGEIPINDFLREAYINSMGLLLVALIGAALVGLTLGGTAALSKRASLSLLTITVLGISVPSFFAALLLQQGAIRYQDAYQQRLVSVAGFGWDWDHMLLPVLVLAARPLAYLTRSSFISLDHVMQQDYIRTALSKGLRRSGIVLVHAFKNMAVPVLTAVSVSLRFSLSTLPVVEFFFAWPGMGMRLIEAINSRQTQVVVALAFALGLTFLIANLLLDIIYRLIDPRLRSEELE
jgi:peptide/nickel transport system permease protein